MPEQLFFGYTDDSGSILGNGANYQVMSTFSSLFEGKITRISYFNRLGTTIKSVMYSGPKNNAVVKCSDTVGKTTAVGTWTDFVCDVDVNFGEEMQIGGIAEYSSVAYKNVTGTRYYNSTPFTGWTPPDPMDASSWVSSTTSANLMAAYGWKKPAITNINPNPLPATGTATLTGTDFMATGATLELCNNSDYSLATIKVSQTIDAQGDSTIDFTIQKGTLGYGCVYAFITTSLGQISAPFAVMFQGDIIDLANNTLASPGNTGQMLGFTEPTEPEEVLSLDMYRFLLDPIRQADATREGTLFVKRYLQGPQLLWQQTMSKIFALKNLMSVTKCPDELLKYLKNIVGWTSDLDYITDGLDYDALRRLIAASPELWKQRGREETIIDLLTLITGANCYMLNWFDYRWITGETIFGEIHEGNDSWIISNPGAPNYGENYSTLKIVDNGDLDKTLAQYLVNFMRAVSERIEIVYIQFFDQFLIDGDDAQWTTTVGDDMVIADGVAKHSATAQQTSVVSVAEAAAWERYICYWKIKSNDKIKIMFGIDGTDYFLLEIILNSNTCNLYLYSNSSLGLLTTTTLTYTALPDIYYGVRIHFETPTIRVYIDGDLIIDYAAETIVAATAIVTTRNADEIHRTTDSGVTWTKVDDATNLLGAASILASTEVNGNEVYIGASSGNVLKSVDYGVNWLHVGTIPLSSQINKIMYISGTTLLAACGGSIYRSVDSGATWTLAYNTTETAVYSMVNFGGGFIVAGTGTGGKTFKSANNGSTWSDKGIMGTGVQRIYGMTNLGSGDAVAGTYPNCEIYRTIDYGENWTLVYAPVTAATAMHELAYLGNNTMLAIDNAGVIHSSSNNGVNWSVAYSTGEAQGACVANLGLGTAIAGTYNQGKLFITEDYGVTWTEVTDFDEEYANRAAAVIEKSTFAGAFTSKGGTGFTTDAADVTTVDEVELFEMPLETDLIDINTEDG